MGYMSLAWWFLLLSFYVCFLSLKSKKHKLPPGPSSLPIVGSLFQLGDRPNESLTELAKTFGPIITLRLGQSLTVVVSSPTLAREVLQKNDHALAGRPVADAVQALDYHKSTIGWLPATAQWRKLRMLCNTYIFASQRLNANQGLRRQKVQELIAYIHDKCKRRLTVNIGHAAFVTSLNSLSNTILSADLMDIDCADSAQELKGIVHGIMEEAARPNIVDYFPLLKLIDPQGVRRRMTAHYRKLYAIFDRLIDDRLQSRSSSETPRQNDFLDVLLDHYQDNDPMVGHNEIKALITELFTAGTDTTSVTLEWIMAELIRNPDAMTKARAEITETVGGGKEVEESDITRLPYLQAIIKETMRLHPTAPLLLPHKAETSVDIGGYTVPKHTRILVNVWAIGRDPELWENPNSFQPERFMGSNIDVKGLDYELIPFGAGRRICPGMPLALRIVQLMLASLLQSFSWKLPNGMKPEDMNMSYKFGLNLQMAIPLLAVPVKE